MRTSAPTRLLAAACSALVAVCALAAPARADDVATDLPAPSATHVLIDPETLDRPFTHDASGLVDPATASETSEVDAATARSARADTISISGTVALDPTGIDPAPYLDGISVSVYDWDGQVVGYSMGASFSFDGLRSDTSYFVLADQQHNLWVDTWYGDAVVSGRATEITSTSRDLLITLERGSTISGASTGTGFPVGPMVAETWYEDPGTGYLWRIGNSFTGEGTHQTTELPRGSYYVRMRDANTEPTFADEWFRSVERLNDATAVEVPYSSTVTGIDFAASPYVWYSGRLAGSDRYATAVETTRWAFDSGIPVLYLASGANWPDALSAGPAASAQGGALLLTDPDRLPSVVADEIRRLDPERIVVVGSSLSVSDAAYRQIAAFAPTTRIGGTDRYDTSRRLVADAFGPVDTVFLATGTNFPDALSVGPIAGRRSEPVLLVDGAEPTIDAPTLAALDSLDPRITTVVGGGPSISQGIEDVLWERGEIVRRLGGEDRADTSRIVNDYYPPSTVQDTAFLALGAGFADALGGATAAAANGSPIYLVERDCIPERTANQLLRQHLNRLILLGGEPTLSDDVLNLYLCG